MDFSKIKLVIWDLDNTFWSGTISEVEINSIDKNIDLIRLLTDAGIINSICSKNTFEVAQGKLKELGIFDFFVFPSIEWTPKGQRVKNQIKTMSLRAENVLFLDDEITNLQEAKHYAPELMVGKPELIEDLYLYALQLGKKDPEHSRLKQYKLLEQKNVEQKKYDSNEDFLFASDIRVIIKTDCSNEIERIHELILRSNQLNFTKKRISLEELVDLLNNKVATCGYVTVSDKFGDNGIVGFYAQIDEKLDHFLFSCRTIGQGIEQYVYAYLHYPYLEITGEVTSNVTNEPAPSWINQTVQRNIEKGENAQDEHKSSSKILVKGPCDLLKAMTYIKHSEFIRTEFTYVNEHAGNNIDAHNHSVHILGLSEYNEKDKQEIVDDCIFVDPKMLDSSMFTEKYDLIFLSTVIESNHGIYKKKNTNLQVAFGEYLFPLTESKFWQGYVDGSVHNANNHFTMEYLKDFSAKYDYEGRTTPEDYIERLKKIITLLGSKTVLCLILGSELPYTKNTNPAYQNRHSYHLQLNHAIRKFASVSRQIKLIELNHFIKDESDYTSSINHFTARVYFDISQAMIKVINEILDVKVEKYSSKLIYLDILVEKLKEMIKNVIGTKQSGLYKKLKVIYLKISRKK